MNNKPIYGIPVGGGGGGGGVSDIPNPDWNQTDETKADFIKNKPEAGEIFTASVNNSTLSLRQSDAWYIRGENGKVDYNLVANALKGNVRGNPIALTDVSPFQHDVACKVESKNLFKGFTTDYEYTMEPGLVISANKNTNVAMVNGACTVGTGSTLFRLIEEPILLKANTPYTLSVYAVGGSASTNKVDLMVRKFADSAVVFTIYEDVSGGVCSKTFTLTEDAEVYIGLHAFNSTTYDNFQVKWQLEKGTTATLYTPYIESVEGLEVKAYGKNLFPNFITDKTYPNSSFVKVNEDGSITVHKVAGDTINETIELPLNAGVYKLSNGYGANKDAWIQVTDMAVSTYYGTTISYGVATITLPKDDTCKITLYTNRAYEADSITFYPQLELGATATAYEPYKEPTTYTTDAEGGLVIPSFAPNMTIVTDSGAVFDVKYNRDINALNTVLDLNAVESKINVAKQENAVKIASTNQVVDSHESRISTIESWIDSMHIYETLENEYDWYDVEGEPVQQSRIILPKNVRKYAKVMKICGHISSYNSTMYYNNMVCNYPYQIMNDNGEVLITIQTDLISNLADFGIQENYIFFEDGKVYYRQGAKIESYDYSVYNMQEGEYVIDSVYDAAEIIGLAKPIITDITDMISIDPIIDIEGCAYLTIVPRVTEDEVKWNAEMGEGESKDYDFNMPKVEIVVEVV